MEYKVWSVKCGVYSVKVWSRKPGKVWSLDRGLQSMEC